MNPYPVQPVDISLLSGKTELVVQSLSRLLEALGGPPPKTAADQIKNLQNYYSAFKGLISNPDELDEAVTQANLVGITAINSVYGIRQFPDLENRISTELGVLESAGRDLQSYCGSHTPSLSALSNDAPMPAVGTPSIGHGNKKQEAQYAQLEAQADEMERSFVAMEARLKAIGDTADKAVARVEELTVQQAEAMRAALSREVSGITESFAGTKQALQDRVGEFDGFREQANEMLGQMSAKLLAGGHMKSAQAEEAAADKFRGWALVAMAAGAAVIIAALVQSYFQPFSWPGLAYRAIVSLLLVIPTAYFARESAKHRAQAIELRRASLDFAALEPFLRNMQGEEGLKVRAELARKAFFSGNAIDATSSYGLDPQAIVIKAMDIAGDAVKKK